MIHRTIYVVVSGIALVLLSAVPAMGQPGNSVSEQWAPPRTSDGQPDLQGVWAHNSATPLERPERASRQRRDLGRGAGGS